MESTATLRPRSRSRHRSKPCSLLPSHLSSKLVLYQAKTLTPTFRPLSFNIIREVCSYIGFIPSLAAIYSKWGYTLNISSTRWKRIGPIPDASGDWFNAVMIGLSEIFVCGGSSGNGKIHTASKRACIVSRDGKREVNPMLKSRASHAIVYVELTASVYVFGGCLSDHIKLNTAEGFSLVRGSWKTLPNMRKIKGYTQGCLCKSTIYLTGADLKTEAFSVLLNTFSTFNIHFPTPNFPILITNRDRLYVFSGTKLLKLSESSSCIEETTALTKKVYSESVLGVVTLGNSAYVVVMTIDVPDITRFACSCVNLDSGEVSEMSKKWGIV